MLPGISPEASQPLSKQASLRGAMRTTTRSGLANPPALAARARHTVNKALPVMPAMVPVPNSRNELSVGGASLKYVASNASCWSEAQQVSW